MSELFHITLNLCLYIKTSKNRRLSTKVLHIADLLFLADKRLFNNKYTIIYYITLYFLSVQWFICLIFLMIGQFIVTVCRSIATLLAVSQEGFPRTVFNNSYATMHNILYYYKPQHNIIILEWKRGMGLAGQTSEDDS